MKVFGKVTLFFFPFNSKVFRKTFNKQTDIMTEPKTNKKCWKMINLLVTVDLISHTGKTAILFYILYKKYQNCVILVLECLSKYCFLGVLVEKASKNMIAGMHTLNKGLI